MTNGPGCPKCGTTVEVHWDWCHACGYDPDRLMPAESRAAGRVVATPAFAAPGPPAQAAPKKSGNVVANLLIVFGGLAVLAVAAFFLLGPRIAKSVAGTRAGSGAQDPVSYTAPDGTYTASLSGSPRSEDKLQGDGTTLHVWGWDGGANGQFVLWGALPAGYEPSMEQQVLQAGADGGITGHGTSEPTTFEGHAARSFRGTFKGVDGRGVFFVANGRMWFLMAAGPWANQDPQASGFMASFQLAPTP